MGTVARVCDGDDLKIFQIAFTTSPKDVLEFAIRNGTEGGTSVRNTRPRLSSENTEVLEGLLRTAFADLTKILNTGTTDQLWERYQKFMGDLAQAEYLPNFPKGKVDEVDQRPLEADSLGQFLLPLGGLIEMYATQG